MEKKEFEALVHSALRDVPEWFLEKLENIEVVIEDEPPRSVLREMEIPKGETLFGLYQGVPLDERGFYYGNVLPDRIVLYMGPLLDACDTEEELEDEVRITVMHEIGHYFGLTDDELEELEKDD
ncbi:MAG TPA: metallopeptidase family protein [Nitrospirota bacterium]|nr:metallopeptidase family protein [Nitrospirota bacterium]